MGAMKSALWDQLPDPERAFDGSTYQPARDYERLSGQLLRVRNAMADGRWHQLDELVSKAGGTVASVSARIRDLRKPKYGARTIERRNAGGGLFEYRMKP